MIFLFKFKNSPLIFGTLNFLLTAHMGPIWVVLWFWRGCTWFSHNLYAVQSSKYNLYLYQIDEMYQEDCNYMNWTARNILNVSIDLWNFIIWFGHAPYGAHMGRTQKVSFIWKTSEIFKNIKVLFSENEIWAHLSLLDSKINYGKKYPPQF